MDRAHEHSTFPHTLHQQLLVTVQLRLLGGFVVKSHRSCADPAVRDGQRDQPQMVLWEFQPPHRSQQPCHLLTQPPPPPHHCLQQIREYSSSSSGGRTVAALGTAAAVVLPPTPVTKRCFSGKHPPKIAHGDGPKQLTNCQGRCGLHAQVGRSQRYLHPVALTLSQTLTATALKHHLSRGLQQHNTHVVNNSCLLDARHVFNNTQHACSYGSGHIVAQAPSLSVRPAVMCVTDALKQYVADVHALSGFFIVASTTAALVCRQISHLRVSLRLSCHAGQSGGCQSVESPH